MTVPKLSIVTRTKNRNLMLERTIKSVRNQTSKDYIHIILNDGGDEKKLEELLKKYPDKNRKVIHNKKSVGIVPALNQAVQQADTKYVSILDDDDTWSKDRVAKVLEYFDAHASTRAAVVKMDIIIEEIADNGEIVKKDQYLHPDSGAGEISLYKQCTRNYVSNGVVTYEKALYDELNGYDERLETAEDWDFGLRMLMVCDVDLIPTEKPLAYYHQRPDDQSETGNSVHAGVRTQEVTLNKIRNKYLREDLQQGRFGLGVIMNQEEYNLQNVVRLEGHMNYIENNLESKFVEVTADQLDEIKENMISNRIINKIRKMR